MTIDELIARLAEIRAEIGRNAYVAIDSRPLSDDDADARGTRSVVCVNHLLDADDPVFLVINPNHDEEDEYAQEELRDVFGDAIGDAIGDAKTEDDAAIDGILSEMNDLIVVTDTEFDGRRYEAIVYESASDVADENPIAWISSYQEYQLRIETNFSEFRDVVISRDYEMDGARKIEIALSAIRGLLTTQRDDA